MIDRLWFLEDLIALYDRVLNDPANDGSTGLEPMSDAVRAQLEGERAKAVIELQGERGARGLNPVTGSSN